MAEDLAESLRAIEIFKELPDSDIKTLAQLCRRRRCRAEEQLVGYRDTTRDVYFIADGRVRITIYSPAGKEIAFRMLTAGDMFGEIAAIDGGARSAAAIAVTDSVILTISAADFRRMQSRMPTVNQALLERLARLVRALSERVYEFSTMAVRNRVHAELLRLARDHMTGPHLANIYPAPTHLEIANRISTHREAVSRELSDLANNGLIERRGRNLVIKDVPGLEELVRSVVAQD